MEHTKDLDDLHNKSMEKLNNYVKDKKNLSQEHHEKLLSAQNNWQAAWTELKQILMYLETLEI